jgi:succinate-acetate transporter protein
VTVDLETAPAPATVEPPSPARTSLGDPLSFGLICFGLCVLLLSVTQAGIVDSRSLPVTVLGISLTAGGLGHVVAGILHFMRGESFPGTVFLCYSTFWMSYVLIVQFYVPKAVATGVNPNEAIGWFLVAFSLVTTYFLITSFATTKTLALLFAVLTTGLYVTTWATFAESSGTNKLGGWILLADSLLALYLAGALTVNSTWGRTIFPTP